MNTDEQQTSTLTIKSGPSQAELRHIADAVSPEAWGEQTLTFVVGDDQPIAGQLLDLGEEYEGDWFVVLANRQAGELHIIQYRPDSDDKGTAEVHPLPEDLTQMPKPGAMAVSLKKARTIVQQLEPDLVTEKPGAAEQRVTALAFVLRQAPELSDAEALDLTKSMLALMTRCAGMPPDLALMLVQTGATVISI